MKKITAVVDKKGKVKLQTDGYTGSSCQDATRKIEAALGKIKSDDLTSEYYTADNVEKQTDQA